MLSLIGNCIKKLGSKNEIKFLYRATQYLTTLPYFFITNELYNGPNKDVMLVLRRSNIDSDTLAIICELSRSNTSQSIFLVCTDSGEFKKMNREILDEINNSDTKIHILQRGTVKFAQALRSSEFVFLKGRNYIERYRWVDRDLSRLYVHCGHGIVTKAVGNYVRTETGVKSLSTSDMLQFLFRDIDVDSVESDIERHSIACACELNPKSLSTFGYPRFDRIRRLDNENAEPILPSNIKTDLSKDGTFRILFAPTTHEHVEAFPFTSGNKEELWKFLDENDIELYIRMHLYQEEGGFYDEIIDGETVKYAGHHASPASIELLPYFDMLLTDYSSIYMEFLPFDRPIAFIDSYHEQFVQSNGLMFDYDRYFPGKKVSELDEFCSYVLSCRDGDDGFSQERQFVRKVFFPPREQSFLQATYFDGNRIK